MKIFLSSILCWLRGHQWQPPEKIEEWWYSYEEVGEGGGLYLEVVRGDGTEEDAWLDSYHGRTCMCCQKFEHL